jgi:hypothetical protein
MYLCIEVEFQRNKRSMENDNLVTNILINHSKGTKKAF